MYAAGAEHPNKAPSIDWLRQVASGEIEASIDAEVLQEILHRYRAIHRWDDGKRVYELARRVVLIVFPITAEVVDRARSLMTTDSGLGARDAVHAAAALLNGCTSICSYDQDLDRISGLVRLAPR